MKVVKRTKQYVYVELGDRDFDEVSSSSDLIRVDKEALQYTSLSDLVKCDCEFEEIDYPRSWVVNGSFKLPNNADEIAPIM